MKKEVAAKPGVAPAVMTVREVAAYLRVHPSTIYRFLKRGQIPGFRIDGGWRFHIGSIDEWRSRLESGLSGRSPGGRADKAPVDNCSDRSTRAGT
jgi:excisionase family DNA binding protein